MQPRGGVPSAVRTVADRGAPFARGQGRPGREPDEGRQTDAPPLLRTRRRRERRECRSADPRREELTRTRGPLPTHLRDVPPLPSEAIDVLDRGCAVLGLDLSSSARAALEGHLRLLLAWTSSVNLTAIRDPVAAARLHVLDSLAGVPLLRELGADRLLDVGSGGGYPGLPLAVALPTRALLLDSVGKKVRFLETAVAATDLADRVSVRAARAESLAAEPAQRGGWPLVTARAVAALPELVELALPLLTVGGSLAAWKRGDIAGELAAAARAAAALGAAPPTVHPVVLPGLDGHALVFVRKLAPTPTGYPREPGARRHRRW